MAQSLSQVRIMNRWLVFSNSHVQSIDPRQKEKTKRSKIGKILGWGLLKSIPRWEDFKQSDSFSFSYLFIKFMIYLHIPMDLVPLICLFTINPTHILMTQWWLCYPGGVPTVISFKNYPDRCWRQLHLTDITYLWDPLNPNASDICREQTLNYD